MYPVWIEEAQRRTSLHSVIDVSHGLIGSQLDYIEGTRGDVGRSIPIGRMDQGIQRPTSAQQEASSVTSVTWDVVRVGR